MAEATVRLVDPVRYPEVEIRLRTSPKDATGYEIMWSALGKKKTAYLPSPRGTVREANLLTTRLLNHSKDRSTA